MEAIFPDLPEQDIRTIVNDINRYGYGVAKSSVPEEALATLRRFVEQGIEQNDGEYRAFTGADAVRGTYLEALAACDSFQTTCRDIYRMGVGREAPEASFYQVLRCLSGKTGRDHAYLFHYDSYVLTALVPVIIPTEGRPGDLILFPNLRPLRNFYLTNLIEKIFIHNAVFQGLVRKVVEWGWVKPRKVRMTPGNVYFFWGARSMHANEPCDEDKIRATALFHYVDPHEDSRLRHLSLGLRGKAA